MVALGVMAVSCERGTPVQGHLVRKRTRLRQSCRGTSLVRNSPPPQDRHRALGIVLLYGPRGALFLMSEVPLYLPRHCLGVGAYHTVEYVPFIKCHFASRDPLERLTLCKFGHFTFQTSNQQNPRTAPCGRDTCIADAYFINAYRFNMNAQSMHTNTLSIHHRTDECIMNTDKCVVSTHVGWGT